MEGRCVKCRKQVEIVNPLLSKTFRGVNIAKGVCPNCGTKVCRMMKKEVQE